MEYNLYMNGNGMKDQFYLRAFVCERKREKEAVCSCNTFILKTRGGEGGGSKAPSWNPIMEIF